MVMDGYVWLLIVMDDNLVAMKILDGKTLEWL